MKAKVMSEDDYLRMKGLEREQVIEEYSKLVANGEVVPPTQLEKSFSNAQGESNNVSVQASRRILAK